MSEPTADVVRLYDLPPYDGEDDYLSDLGIARIATHVIEQLPHDGFDMSSLNATTRGVQTSITFDKPRGPMQNADTFEAMLRAVTVVRTLHANLLAARARIAAHEGQLRLVLDQLQSGRHLDAEATIERALARIEPTS